MNGELAPELRKTIFGMVEQLQTLTTEAITDLKPQVYYVIHHRIADDKQIEMLLDKLLDYAGMSEDGQALFKRLCRYYFPINPNATAEYVYTYRDLYDSDTDKEGEEYL